MINIRFTNYIPCPKIKDLEVICSENEFECSVECCLLQWNKNTNYGDLEERFDYIICADW
jgi:hypothetical protein